MMQSDDERLRRLFALLRREEEQGTPPFERMVRAVCRHKRHARRLWPRLSLVVSTLAAVATILGVAVLREREPAPSAIRIQTTPLVLPLDCLLEPPTAVVAEAVPDFGEDQELVWRVVPLGQTQGGGQ